MNRDQLLADRLDQQGSDNGAVHAAGQGEQDLFIPDLLTDGLDLFFDKGVGEFRGCNALHAFGPFVAIHLLSSNRSAEIHIDDTWKRIEKDRASVNLKR